MTTEQSQPAAYGAATAAALDMVSDGVIALDGAFQVIWCNEAAERIWGVRARDVAGSSVREMIPDLDRKLVLKDTAASGSFQKETLKFAEDGSLMRLEITARPMEAAGSGSSGSYLVVARRLCPTADFAGVPILILDSAGIVKYASTDAARFLGHSPVAAPGLDFYSHVHPEEMAEVRGFLHSLLQRADQAVPALFRLRRSDGRWRWVEANARNLLHDTNVRGIVIAFGDVTAHREMEEALRDQRQLLETVLDNIPAMVSMLDSRGHVVYLNRECQRVLGWSEKEIREHPDILGEIYPDPEQRDLAVKFIADAARTWAEWRMATKHGRIVNAVWMYLRVGDLLLGIGIDLSDRRRMQADWRRIRDDLETRVERQYKAAAPYGLTFRELTVLSLVAGGRTDREIADTLSIGYRTVQSHISSILAKMNARARTEAGVRAVREGIVD